MRDTSPEVVKKRAEIWFQIEPDVKRHCQRRWPDMWEDILAEGMVRFLSSHDIDRECFHNGLVGYAIKQCLIGVREEARQNGLPQKMFRKKKPDNGGEQNNTGGEVVGGHGESGGLNSKPQFVAPKFVSFDVLAESGFQISDKDPTETIEKTIFVKGLLQSALGAMEESEAEKYIGAINLVFEGHELAVAARKNGLNPVYLSRWLAKIGYANGRSLPASSTKRTAQPIVPTVAVTAEVVVVAVVTPQPPQLPITTHLAITPVLPAEPFLGFTEYVQSQLELFDADVIQLVEKTPKSRAHRKTSPKQIVLTSNIDQLAFNFDNIDNAVTTPSLEADASATEITAMNATQEPGVDSLAQNVAVKRKPYKIYGYNGYVAINLARFNQKQAIEKNQTENSYSNLGTHYDNYLIHRNRVINNSC